MRTRSLIEYAASPMTGWQRNRSDVAAVVAFAAIGFGLRLAWALSIAPRQGSDAHWYSEMALSLASGAGYQQDGRPTAYYPVGYAAALGLCHRLFGSEPAVARVANAVFGLGTLLGLYGTARALSRSSSAALLTLLLFVIYPADIGFTSVTLSQVLFNTGALLGCALCLSRRLVGALAGGVLLGGATLTRVQGFALLPLICVALLATREFDRRWLRALLVSIGFVAVIGPWTIRNVRAFHAFVPVATNGGINLYIGNNPRARGRYYYTSKIDAPIAAVIKGPRRGGPNEIMVDRLARDLAWQYVAAHPRKALALWPAKFHYLYDRDSAFADWSHKLPDEWSMTWLERLKQCDRIYYPSLFWLAAFGAVVTLLEMSIHLRGAMAFPALVVLAFTGLHMLTFGDPSYHHPMMPWLVIYAGYGLSAPWRHRHRISRTAA